MLGPLALFKTISIAMATCLEELNFLAPILQRVNTAGIAHQVDQEEAAIFLLSSRLQQWLHDRPCAIILLHLLGRRHNFQSEGA